MLSALLLAAVRPGESHRDSTGACNTWWTQAGVCVGSSDSTFARPDFDLFLIGSVQLDSPPVRDLLRYQKETFEGDKQAKLRPCYCQPRRPRTAPTRAAPGSPPRARATALTFALLLNKVPDDGLDRGWT